MSGELLRIRPDVQNLGVLGLEPVVGGRRPAEGDAPGGKLADGGDHGGRGEADMLDAGAAVLPQEGVHVAVRVAGQRLRQHQFEV